MNNPRNDRYRHQILRIIVFAVFGFFALTAGYLQLIEGNSYIDKAENNYIRYIITYPPRGEVFDRNGEYLIQNKVVYDLMVVPREAPRKGIDTVRLATITNEPMKRLKRSLNEARRSWRTASPVVKYLSAESKLKMDEWNLPGFYTVPRTVRQYPRRIGGNLLGSLSEVSQNFLAKYNDEGYYSIRDYIGEQGIESAYERELRGEKGRIRPTSTPTTQQQMRLRRSPFQVKTSSALSMHDCKHLPRSLWRARLVLSWLLSLQLERFW
jgi:penicillin-binding protein 2